MARTVPIAANAIAAVDVALWDLKARLLELPLVTLLGAYRDTIPVYGSGGFTSYPIERLQAQLGELQRRPAEPMYVHEVQQSLALGAPSPHHGEVRSAPQLDLDGGSADLDQSVDLDEFEDDRLPEDGDLISEDD
jgi:hypothetical protein